MKAALLIALAFAVGCPSKNNALPAEAWGVSDYAAAGVPAVDHAWTHAEYVRAATVLTETAADHPERLPHYKGARSGPVFDRLLEMPVGDQAAPIGARLLPHVERYEQINALSKRYVNNALATPQREWIELMGALLRESVEMQPLLEPFLESFGSNDPKGAVRRDGLTKMREGWGGMLLGGIGVAGDTRAPEADRIAMVTLILPALPNLFPEISADQQAAIRELTDKLIHNGPEGTLRGKLVTAQELMTPLR